MKLDICDLAKHETLSGSCVLQRDTSEDCINPVERKDLTTSQVERMYPERVVLTIFIIFLFISESQWKTIRQAPIIALLDE